MVQVFITFMGILHLWLTFITFMVIVTVIQQLLNEAE